MCPRMYLILMLHINICGSRNLRPLLRDAGWRGQYRLDGKNISEIRDNAFDSYHNVQYVFLENNSISKISPSAFIGTKIKLLNLRRNRLTCIPDLQPMIHTLDTLLLDKNRLGDCEMGKQICSGTYTMARLFLSYNDLTQLPWIKYRHYSRLESKPVYSASVLML